MSDTTIVAKRTVLPIAVSELEQLGVEMEDIPEGITYAAIFASKYDLKRGVKRWVTAGCPDPFKYSTSYSRLYGDCARLKAEVDQYKQDIQSYEELKQNQLDTISGLKDHNDKITQQQKESDRQKNLNEYRVQALTKQVETLESTNAQLDATLQTGNETIVDCENDISRLKGEVHRLKAQNEELIELRKKTDTQIRQADSVVKSATDNYREIQARLEKNGWRRFIVWLFRI